MVGIMKIAIVGPSPVPFTIGGAENLLWGLCEAINQYTDHQAELIKLPSLELNFWDLIETYYKFFHLNLDHFDLVISTKYPSWMVRHKNCICYMVHTLRGLYDTYHLMNLPGEVDRSQKDINKLLDYIVSNQGIDKFETVFQMLFELKGKKEIPQKYFEFPGPLIRELLHYFDQGALSQPGMKKLCAISKTVKNRKEYYPKESNVEVIYPPTVLKERKRTENQMDYIFFASRLDAPKRIDLLIRAMKYVRNNIPLYIAGNGPQRQELEKLAGKDSRIHFLGFISDTSLEEYYSNSLVIPYFPYDEDYGLITIEAMLHKKPVITTKDAGGPTEFVKNGKTGFVTRFDAKEVAEKIDYLFEHPEEAKRMGENAYQCVKDITWENTISGLLGENIVHAAENTQVRPKEKVNKSMITVTSPFAIYPPRNGGQARIFNLYKKLAKDFEINIVSFTNADQKRFEGTVAARLKEIRIPKTKKHQDMEWEIEEKAKIPISDIGLITLFDKTPEYCEVLSSSIQQSELVIISHPYLYNAAKKYLEGRPFVYEAHNVEYLMKQGMLPASPIKEKLVKQVFEIEKECCEQSQFIITCSEEDKVTIQRLYHIPIEKMIEIPNGVDCTQINYTPISERMRNKKSLELENETIGIFMGSWHQPNLEACENLFQIAKQCPEVKFLLMGSQCDYFRKKRLPQNVGLLGLVSEQVKATVFSTADFALNPMLSGSGTNLKMFDYMAGGLPVITTKFGTRGIYEKKGFLISEVEEMPEVIRRFQLYHMEEQVEFARRYVEEKFDWAVISDKLAKKILELRLEI